MNFLLEKFKNIGKKFFLSDIDKHDYVMMAVLDEIRDSQKKRLRLENNKESFVPNQSEYKHDFDDPEEIRQILVDEFGYEGDINQIARVRASDDEQYWTKVIAITKDGQEIQIFPTLNEKTNKRKKKVVKESFEPTRITAELAVKHGYPVFTYDQIEHTPNKDYPGYDYDCYVYEQLDDDHYMHINDYEDLVIDLDEDDNPIDESKNNKNTKR